MNTWRKQIATATAGTIMALGAVAMVSGTALAANTSSGSQSTETYGTPSSGAQSNKSSMEHENQGWHNKAKAGESMGKNMSKSEVKDVQRALDHAGYKVSVDGKMGPKTASALKQYQKAHGLQATGHVNKETLQKLGVKG